jgi:hypothetical protein
MKRVVLVAVVLSLFATLGLVFLRGSAPRERPAPETVLPSGAPAPHVAPPPASGPPDLQRAARTRRAAGLPAPSAAAALARRSADHTGREPARAKRGGEQAPAAWDAEEPDQDATDELTKYFAQALGELGVDGELDELTCKRTLCRVNAHFADINQALKFEAAAGLVERRRAMNFSVTDGVVDIEVFLARD